jgi:hypothetical protein
LASILVAQPVQYIFESTEILSGTLLDLSSVGSDATARGGAILALSVHTQSTRIFGPRGVSGNRLERAGA